MQRRSSGSSQFLTTALLAAGLWGCTAAPDARMAPPDDKNGESAANEASIEAPASEPPASEALASEPPASEARASEASEEPEIEWLVGEDGKEYRVRELRKGIDVRDWIWLDDNRIQVNFGIQYDVVRHDERAFYVRQYKKRERAAPSREEIELARREKEKYLAEVAASYRAEIETVDRLRLTPFDQGLPRSGQWRNRFDVADMNGDGHLDIVFGPARKMFPPLPSIFLGDGQGAWRLWRQARFPAFPYDYGAAAAADVNGDGHMDLAFGMHLKGILVLVGDGNGGFEAWSEGIGLEVPGRGGAGTTFSSRAVELVDWNGDQKPDLLALGEGPKGIEGVLSGGDDLKSANGPIFFLNQGDGSWRPKGYESGVFGDALALGDFDGDGRLDFATASRNIGYTSLLHLGRGVDDWEALSVPAFRPSALIPAVASGRLDGDAIDDLVVGYASQEGGVWRSGADVLFGAEAGELRRRPLFSTEERNPVYGLATGDVDGDGRRDVALTTGNGEVRVFLADASGFFAREASPELPEPIHGCRGYGLRLVDLNGDGRAELIASFAGEGSGMPPAFGRSGCPDGGSLRVWSPQMP